MTLSEILGEVAKLNESQKATLRRLALNYLRDGDTFEVTQLGAEPGRRAGGVSVFVKHLGTCHALRLASGGRVITRAKWGA